MNQHVQSPELTYEELSQLMDNYVEWALKLVK